MSSWKLVEAVVDGSPAASPAGHKKPVNVSNAVKGGNGSSHRSSGRGTKGNQQRTRRTSKMDAQTMDQYLVSACQQILFILSSENLCMDMFIRAYMDEAGYVPLSVLCSYPNVACFGLAVTDIVNKLTALEDSPVDVDAKFETVKLKEKWEMWLMPNNSGGRGVPLYSAQPGPFQFVDPSAMYYDMADGTECSGEDWTGMQQQDNMKTSEELSADASEFVPSNFHPH